MGDTYSTNKTIQIKYDICVVAAAAAVVHAMWMRSSEHA